eukprot:scaffold133672_cov28-Tisochrysis_lutea.AAC.2
MASVRRPSPPLTLGPPRGFYFGRIANARRRARGRGGDGCGRSIAALASSLILIARRTTDP